MTFGEKDIIQSCLPFGEVDVSQFKKLTKLKEGGYFFKKE
jgi:hypothetical protein